MKIKGIQIHVVRINVRRIEREKREKGKMASLDVSFFYYSVEEKSKSLVA
jgi:hypothetical protein